MSTEDPDLAIERARLMFEEEDVKAFTLTATAMRALIATFDEYMEADDDSADERMYYTSISAMADSLQGRPEHAKSMIFALLSVIRALREGIPYETWLREAGLEPKEYFRGNGT